jgi:tRNA modification GTPase
MALPETIAAIATPPGSGGIGIIRVSGPKARIIASILFQPRRQTAAATGTAELGFETHRLYYGDIVDPRTRQRIDEVLLTLMKAPHTYTREDVLEIQAHSGSTVLGTILALVIDSGARLAEPGEFTRRAFLNGRIDLTQAEAVIDVINARGKAALTAATNQIHGELRQTIGHIRHALTDLLVRIEAGIDFPEDVSDILPPKETAANFGYTVVNPLRDLIRQSESAQIFREGLDLVIIGKPNVGKSSLMNRLLERNRVIVTPSPGTTRDVIEEGLNITGVPINLVDTAGIHQTEDPIERIGIERTGARINGARMVLFVVDVSENLTDADEYIFQNYCKIQMVLVQNKVDRIAPEGKACARLPDHWRGFPTVRVSALHS